MSTSKPIDYGALMRDALDALDRSQARVAVLEAGAREPIAVVGIGCRLPGGVDSAEAFWRHLDDGVDAIGPVPAQRWDADRFFNADPDVPGTICTRLGGFVQGIDGFDAGFFQVSPREAASMDPQQRMLLEVAWEALEDAGEASADRDGRPAGVFVGITAYDYSNRLLAQDGPSGINAYFSSGNSLNVAAGRLSYALGFQGPSLAVDTACSSSLVTVHLACQSLRARECDMALAGGVNAILTPEGSIATSRAHMLAPDGRCKTFDARADGYVRSEGCGLIVLKRLGDAVARQDRILAVIRGSAVNQNGAGSGLTVPSGPAQARLIVRALDAAGLRPRDVGYVEAHGTGTALGDPIEINALASVFGRDRGDAAPLVVGSVKTNIGHLESAAGIAGLIKVVLVLRNGRIPGHLHFHNGNPLIRWDTIPIEIPVGSRPWPDSGAARIAGVSAFGFSGTNAHVVVEEAPRPADIGNEVTGAHHLLVLSAPSPDRLTELASAYADRLRNRSDTRLADICFTSGVGRAHFRQRAALVGDTAEQMAAILDQWVRHGSTRDVAQGSATGDPPRIAFLFTGQGAQRAGMGRELFATHPVFREAVERCSDALRDCLEIPLVDVLYGRPEHALLIRQTSYAQPALFCLSHALACVWRTWGIEPDVVMGHSVGEFAAACAAGVFSVEDGARIVAERGRLMQSIGANGVMVAVHAPEGRVREAIDAFADTVTVAAINGPEETVISGPAAHVTSIVDGLRRIGVRTRSLDVSDAFHSPLMQPIVGSFERFMRQVPIQRPAIRMVSNLSGDLVDEALCRPEHWARHVVAPVNFMAGMRTLAALGCDAYVELGPSPILLAMARTCNADSAAVWLASLRPPRADGQQMQDSLGRLHVRGARVDWEGLYRGTAPRRVSVPRSSFRRTSYWAEGQRSSPSRIDTPASEYFASNIGARLALPGSGDVRFQALYEAAHPAYLTDHRLDGVMVVPAASHIVAALSAAAAALDRSACTLREILFPRIMTLADDERLPFQIVLHPGKPMRFEAFSAGDAHDDWSLHAQGEIADAGQPPPQTMPFAPPAGASEASSGRLFYEGLRQNGYTLGPAFCWIERIWLNGGEAIAELRKPPPADTQTYPLHPGLLDSCFQVLAALQRSVESPESSAASMYVPFRIDRMAFHQTPGDGALWCRVRLQENGDGAARALRAGIELMNGDGVVLMQIDGFEAREMPRAAFRAARMRENSQLLYDVTWTAAAPDPLQDKLESSQAVRAWLVLSDEGEIGNGIAERLSAQGEPCAIVRRGRTFGHPDPAHFLVDPDSAGDFRRLIETWSTETDAARCGIVHLWSVAPRPGESLTLERLQDEIRVACSSVLGLVGALAEMGAPARLWLVTRGAQAAAEGDRRLCIEHAPLWGLARVVAREHPRLKCVCIDLDPSGDEGDVQHLLDELLGPDGEDQIALRGPSRLVARLVPHRRANATHAPQPSDAPVREGSSYLVTGGLGALGLRVARWLVEERGARHLVLASRRDGSVPEVRAALREIEALGATVRIETIDIADRAAVRRMLDRISGVLPPLHGIIHAAGIVDDALLANVEWSHFAAVLAPKISGGWILHEETLALDLDFFVAFSSTATWLGAPGQGAYAAANAFLQALIHHRRSVGARGICVEWGPWAERGMAARMGAREQARLSAAGIDSLSDEQALTALGSALREDLTRVAVIAMRWPEYFATDTAFAPSPFLRAFNARPALRRDQDSPSLRDALEAAGPDGRRGLFERHVLERVANVLGYAPHAGATLDAQAGFFDLGMDSLSALELRNALQRDLGCDLPATLAFKYPTVAALVDGILDTLAPPADKAAIASHAPRASDAIVAGVTTLSESELASIIDGELDRLST